MASIATLVQTEKAYNLQQGQVFVIRFNDDYTPNKIEVTNILTKNDLHPLNVNIVNLPDKTKRKGKRTKVLKRATKYYIKLKIGETLDEEKLEKIFPKIEKQQQQ